MGEHMDNLRFDFSNLHTHGNAFYQFLGLRKRVLVDQLRWQVPHNDEVEMDQYDTPAAHYSVVVRAGKVIGGARTMATSTMWGEHRYMLRDAYAGKLEHIPPAVMPHDISCPTVWECTRLVMSQEVTTQAERSACLRMIIDGLVEIVQERAGVEMICLSSMHLMRAMRQLGYEVTPMGDTYRNAEDGRVYAVLGMPAAFSRVRQGIMAGQRVPIAAR
jgi:N-acyl-L-homoserine lactone synthetase